ncbi:hypothetical protein ACFQJ8_20155, partial [Halocatena marina]
MRDATELSQSSQVLYRLEQHLIPAGFVEEARREREHDFRKFRLTGSGQMWVDEHAEALEYPATRAETQEMAYEAVEQAESAKESVQNYRKKLHRMGKVVDDLKGLEEQVEENSTKLGYQGGSISGLRSRKADDEDVASVRTDLVDFRGEMEEKHEAAVDHVRGRLDAQEMRIGEMQGEMEQLRDENSRLRSDV